MSEWKKKNLLTLSIRTFHITQRLSDVLIHSLTATTLCNTHLTERHIHTQTNIAADYMKENQNIHGSIRIVLSFTLYIKERKEDCQTAGFNYLIA